MPGMVTRWLVVGSGRCGVQLARSMTAAGVPVVGVTTRGARGRGRVRRLLPGVRVVSTAAPLGGADALLIAVPDDRLAECAVEIDRRVAEGITVALHTSGLHPGAVLSPLRQRGIAVGSFHPLVSFPAPGGPRVALAGVMAAVEGDPPAVHAGLALARGLGMTGRLLASADKASYHAAATLAGSLTHVLVAEARSMLERTGLARAETERALRPLVEGAVAAALSAAGLERLTGPVPRGDVGTIRTHLSVLDGPLADAYRAVSALAAERIRALREPGTVAKSALDSVLTALTAKGPCGSVPADGLD
jgi:predicted short-subunit dehydrogenase-like oxidoreductase (DUF2520 family)